MGGETVNIFVRGKSIDLYADTGLMGYAFGGVMPENIYMEKVYTDAGIHSGDYHAFFLELYV